MKKLNSHQALTVFIALVWFVNGLFCKVLNLVPRHQAIVSEILGSEMAPTLTFIIGILELGMVVWILSGIKSRLCAITQMVIVGAMNILEFTLVPDLLLWGRLNAFFAALFIVLVWYNEFILKKGIKSSVA